MSIIKNFIYIPGDYSWEFLGGCVTQFSKSWPYFRPKSVIFHTRFQTRPLKPIPIARPGLWAEIMSSLLRFFKMLAKFLHVSFFVIQLELKQQICSYTPVDPSNPYLIQDQNGQRVYSFSDWKGTKTIPFGAAHTHMA